MILCILPEEIIAIHMFPYLYHNDIAAVSVTCISFYRMITTLVYRVPTACNILVRGSMFNRKYLREMAVEVAMNYCKSKKKTIPLLVFGKCPLCCDTMYDYYENSHCYTQHRLKLQETTIYGTEQNQICYYYTTSKSNHNSTFRREIESIMDSIVVLEQVLDNVIPFSIKSIVESLRRRSNCVIVISDVVQPMAAIIRLDVPNIYNSLHFDIVCRNMPCESKEILQNIKYRYMSLTDRDNRRRITTGSSSTCKNILYHKHNSFLVINSFTNTSKALLLQGQ